MTKKLKQIHHVAYRYRDVSEAVSLDQRGLGMDLVLPIAEDHAPSIKLLDPYMYAFLAAASNYVLAFFQLPNSPPISFDANTPDWVQHIVFELEDIDCWLPRIL